MKEQEVIPQNDFTAGFRDLEEKQRLLKDRLLLVGQNLIDFREKNEEEILNLKKDVDIIKTDIEKIKNFLETISGEFKKFAKKEDFEILAKQAKMFQPMEFVKKSDLEKLKKNEDLKE